MTNIYCHKAIYSFKQGNKKVPTRDFDECNVLHDIVKRGKKRTRAKYKQKHNGLQEGGASINCSYCS